MITLSVQEEVFLSSLALIDNAADLHRFITRLRQLGDGILQVNKLRYHRVRMLNFFNRIKRNVHPFCVRL